VFRGQIRVVAPKARIQQWQEECRQQATEAEKHGRIGGALLVGAVYWFVYLRHANSKSPVAGNTP